MPDLTKQQQGVWQCPSDEEMSVFPLRKKNNTFWIAEKIISVELSVPKQ